VTATLPSKLRFDLSRGVVDFPRREHGVVDQTEVRADNFPFQRPALVRNRELEGAGAKRATIAKLDESPQTVSIVVGLRNQGELTFPVEVVGR
jgi:hypothetical protein